MQRNDSTDRQFTGVGFLLVLLGLTGFAITDPLLSIMGESSGLFAFHNTDTRAALTGYALVVAVAPAITAWLLLKLLGVVRVSLGHLSSLLLVAALSTLWAIQVTRWTLEIQSPMSILAIGTAFGALVLLAYRYWKPARTFLKLTSLMPAAAVMAFLFSSNTASLSKNSESTVEQVDPTVDYPSVLFLIVDEFPTQGLINEKNQVDSVRYPNLAGLAQESTWYRHYTVLADKTSLSVPALLSGQPPSSGAATSAKYPTNLFALLEPTHHLTAFEAITRLCSYDKCTEAGPGQSHKSPPQYRTLFQKTTDLWLRRVNPWESGEVMLDDYAEPLVEATPKKQKKPESLLELLFTPEKLVSYTQAKSARLERFKSAFSAHAAPALYFLHLELPHVPWRFYADGSVYDAAVKKLAITASVNGSSEWMATVAEHRFAMQAEHTDRIIGELFSHLKSLGIWDDMLVVVTSDHGRSFTPNTNARVLSPETLGGIAYAPLFIKTPGQTAGRIDDSNLMAHDLLPTVADLLGIELPWPVTGLAASDPARNDRGQEKFCYPKLSEKSFKPLLGEKITFLDSDTYPRYADRRIGAKEKSGDPLAQLNQILELGHYLGRSPEDFVVSDGGTARVEELERLRNPGGKHPMGMVMGNLEFTTGADTVVIGINGELITGSPLFSFQEQHNTFLAMLPVGALQSNNEIEVYLVEEEGLARLQLL